MADLFDRSLGIGYTGDASILLMRFVLARDLVPHPRLDQCSNGFDAEGGTLLLGDEHIFANPGDRSRGLDGGRDLIKIRWRHCCVLCGTPRAGSIVLGCFHPDTPPWRDRRRLPRNEPWGPRQPGPERGPLG
jgi:hypothetical protein